MFPYSHLSIAYSCRPHLSIESESDFYIGAIAPDIRYYKQAPRGDFHFPVSRLDPFLDTDPKLASFALGYRFHLIVDELWYEGFEQQYQATFPFFIREKLSQSRLGIAFEMYCLEHHPVSMQLQATENRLTESLGVSQDDLRVTTSIMQEYIDGGDLQAAMIAARDYRIFPPERLENFDQLITKIESNFFLSRFIPFVVKRASRPIYSEMATLVVSALRES